MEKTWEEKLAEILAKEPAALTEGDKEFLKARRSYLTPSQAELYAEALGNGKASAGSEQSTGEAPAGPKKKK